jgi:predicted flap endonuclease-1-like 5' DNA nuclease
MGILDKIKSVLGMGDSTSERDGARRESDSGVTVERERTTEADATAGAEAEPGRSEPATGGDRAGEAEPDRPEPAAEEDRDGEEDVPSGDVADTDTGVGADTEAETEPETETDPGAGTADTEEVSDQEGAVEDGATAVETDVASSESTVDEAGGEDVDPGEAAGPADTAVGAEGEESGAGLPSEGEGDSGAAAAEADEAGEPVTRIKGIGPAYAETLAAVGVGSVDDLAAADASDLAERTDVSEKRLERWIGRAKNR